VVCRSLHAAPNRVLASGQRVPRSIKVESARLGPKLSTARLPASPADVAAAIDIDGPASDQLGERLAQKHGGDTDIEDINADLAVGLHSADAGPLAGERIEHVNLNPAVVAEAAARFASAYNRGERLRLAQGAAAGRVGGPSDSV
jgi:hypothetical protein